MLRWYNLTPKIRVYVSDDDLEFINKYRRSKKVPKSSLTVEEASIADALVQKAIFGRYKTETENIYLFNK